MVFSSFLFLFLFLPITSAIYAFTPRRFKNTCLLIASMLFYLWGAPIVLPFLLLACVFDFFISFLLIPGRISEKNRQRLFSLAVICNLSALFYYKYFNFVTAEVGKLLLTIGITPHSFPEVLLPVGISFFTFHKISYLGDVYRGKVLPASSLIDYCLYILFFPQLIAGPIIRYADVATQFKNRIHSIDSVYQGITRLCIGLGKKVLIADSLGTVVNQVFEMHPGQLSIISVWLAVICYSFQIFFDFSGYSDMAIGLARIFGFTFLENFNRPYRSRTFTEFWHRWHISLSNFMREYLYIPLGGNRISKYRTHLNLWITFLLSGLWHGASWNFVIWGAFHGSFLTLDKFCWDKIAKRLPNFINITITFLLVTVGWVFFRADTLNQAFDFLKIMLGFAPATNNLPRAYLIDNRQLSMLLLAAIICFAPNLDKTWWKLKFETYRCTTAITAAKSLSAFILLWLSAAALASRGYTPFLYFKF